MLPDEHGAKRSESAARRTTAARLRRPTATRRAAQRLRYFSCSQKSAGMSWAIFSAPLAPP